MCYYTRTLPILLMLGIWFKSEMQTFPKIWEPAQNFRRQDGDINNFHNRDQQILYATGQNVFSTVTWGPGVTHHSFKSAEQC
jgi:hypothetical protein